MADIPPELMKMMQSGQPPAGGGMQPPSGAGAPVSAPMSAPQDNAGDKQGAMAQVQMAVKILEQTLIAFGSDTEEGRAVLSCLSTLGKKFGESKDHGRALIPSEIMNLQASMPKGAGGMPPGGQAAQPQPPMQ